MPSFELIWSHFRLLDAIDILLFAILLYVIIQLLRGSIAINILIGYGLLYVSYLLVQAFNMEVLTAFLSLFFQVGIIALVIVFQPEIRKMFLSIGKNAQNYRNKYFYNWLYRGRFVQQQADSKVLQPILEASKSLKDTKTGALIVFAQSDDEEHIYRNGQEIEAVVSKRILECIFNKSSPLHDGAVIISRGKIQAAGCILPLTDNLDLPAFMGLRHRAALGVVEHTNVSALVISEETGNLAYAKGGKISTHITMAELEQYLRRDLMSGV